MSGRGQAAKEALAEWKQGLGYRDMVERAAAVGRDTVQANVVASARRREGIEEAFSAGARQAIRASDAFVVEARERYLEQWEECPDYARGLQAAFCEGYDAASGVPLIDEPTRRLRVYYLPESDVLSINGVRYAAGLFRTLEVLQVGTTFRVVERDSTIALEEIQDEKGVTADERAELCEDAPKEEQRRPATLTEAFEMRRVAVSQQQLSGIADERRRARLLADLEALLAAGRLERFIERVRAAEQLTAAKLSELLESGIVNLKVYHTRHGDSES